MSRAGRHGALALAALGAMAGAMPAFAQSVYSPRQTYGYGRWDAPARSSWQGAYAGLHLGYGFGTLTTGFPVAATATNNGGIGGVHIGHNWQQDRLVFGIEGDLSASWASGASNGANGVLLDGGTAWLASLRGRMGYSFGSALLYATGGVALSRVEATVTNGGWAGKADDILLGWTIGGGLEYKVAPNVSTRIEALHYSFGDKEIGTWSGIAPFAADQTVVRAGITFSLR
jgi:outer membrane immunogenic protein